MSNSASSWGRRPRAIRTLRSPGFIVASTWLLAYAALAFWKVGTPSLILLALTILGSFVVALVTAAFAPPLEPVARKSMLFQNLALLGRFGLSALLIVISGIVGAVIGAELQAQISGQVTPGYSSSFYQQILLSPVEAVVVVAPVALSIGLLRLGRVRRIRALTRAIVALGGRDAVRALRSSWVRAWIGHLAAYGYKVMSTFAGVSIVALVVDLLR
jgi:hypothetical protein